MKLPDVYLDSIANVFVGTKVDDYVKPDFDYVKQTCANNLWIATGECSLGHRFAREIVCGKEFCERCGEDGSVAHGRRIARWLPKVLQLNNVGYFVFTIPWEWRFFYRSPRELRRLRRDILDLLRFFGFSRGLARFHWFGDRYPGLWHPHLNVLVEGGYLSPDVLGRIRALYAVILGVEVADCHYEYVATPGQKYHVLEYVTRATFRDKNWDEKQVILLKNFRNAVSFGSWKDAPIWSLDDLYGDCPECPVGDIHAVQALEYHICPECGREVRWRGILPAKVLALVDNKPLGLGFYRVYPDIPPPH